MKAGVFRCERLPQIQSEMLWHRHQLSDLSGLFSVQSLIPLLRLGVDRNATTDWATLVMRLPTAAKDYYDGRRMDLSFKGPIMALGTTTNSGGLVIRQSP